MDIAQTESVARAAEALTRARAVVALTGAGISAESGVPTFRGSGGLWRTFRAEDLATPEAFARDPGLVWEWYRWRRGRIAGVQPNAGHVVLARFEHRWPSFALLTQNVDGLHRRAGSKKVVELHGTIWRARCTAERGRVVDESVAVTSDVPTCPACGALLRPDVVWFGEALDPETVERASDAASSCDVLLVVGTSAIVYPAAALPALARRSGATVVEINIDATPLTAEAAIVLRGASGIVLPELERRL